MSFEPLERIDGIVPIVPTPFDSNEEIDFQSLRGLIDFAHAAGVCAVCLPAYASEFYKLDEAERRRVVWEAVDQAAGRIEVRVPGADEQREQHVDHGWPGRKQAHLRPARPQPCGIDGDKRERAPDEHADAIEVER